MPKAAAGARAGAVPPDAEGAQRRRRDGQPAAGRQVPGERAEAGRVRERAGRAAEPGAGPAGGLGGGGGVVQSDDDAAGGLGGGGVVVQSDDDAAAVLPPAGRAGRPGRGRVPLHGAAGQRAGPRPAEHPRPAQRRRQLLRQEGPAGLPVPDLIDRPTTTRVHART